MNNFKATFIALRCEIDKIVHAIDDNVDVEDAAIMMKLLVDEVDKSRAKFANMVLNHMSDKYVRVGELPVGTKFFYDDRPCVVRESDNEDYMFDYDKPVEEQVFISSFDGTKIRSLCLDSGQYVNVWE